MARTRHTAAATACSQYKTLIYHAINLINNSTNPREYELGLQFALVALQFRKKNKAPQPEWALWAEGSIPVTR